jgi:hypothetical protein
MSERDATPGEASEFEPFLTLSLSYTRGEGIEIPNIALRDGVNGGRTRCPERGGGAHVSGCHGGLYVRSVQPGAKPKCMRKTVATKFQKLRDRHSVARNISNGSSAMKSHD